MDCVTMNPVLILLVSAFVPALITANNEATSSSPTPQNCILPEYPEHGTYSVLGEPSTKPGQSIKTVALNYTCQENYGIVGSHEIFCISGAWSGPLPKCIQCGRITPEGESLTIGGHSSTGSNLPWNAAIYTKTTKPYIQLCGGTLISTSVVLSAAHCFWSNSDSISPKENYAVALGKKYRPWEDERDTSVHKSDVKGIHIPPSFLGASANYQSDIAVVVMEQAVVYKINIRPICLNFDVALERTQLRVGNLGKIGGWSIDTNGNDRPSRVLKVVEMPYIEVSTCIAEAPSMFRPFITADKICAGFSNGTALCRGDSGAGLAFPSREREVERYYLRGIMSTAPVMEEDKLCHSSIVGFTRISHHEHFIKEHLLD